MNREVARPNREPDYISIYGYQYWFYPEWIRHSEGKYGSDSGNHLKVSNFRITVNDDLLTKHIQDAFEKWYKNQYAEYTLLELPTECLQQK